MKGIGWSLGGGGVAVVIALALGRKKSQKLLHIVLRFQSEDRAQAALATLNATGKIDRMINFDGEKMGVVFLPERDRPNQWRLSMPHDVQIESATEITTWPEE